MILRYDSSLGPHPHSPDHAFKNSMMTLIFLLLFLAQTILVSVKTRAEGNVECYPFRRSSQHSDVCPSQKLLIITQLADPDQIFLGTRSKYQRSEYLQYHCPHSQAMSSGISEADALALLKQLEQKYEALGLLEKAETEAFQKQLLDVAMLSLEKSLKSVTTSLIER